jgi:hypothetical protein
MKCEIGITELNFFGRKISTEGYIPTYEGL